MKVQIMSSKLSCSLSCLSVFSTPAAYFGGLGTNRGLEIGYPDSGICDFPHSLQANCMIVS